MKNRTGFTLIEILGVIAVLAVIMLVTAPTILKTLKNAGKDQYNTYVETLYLATETYLSQNKEKYPQLETVGGSASISIRVLQDEKLVKKTLKNPKTDTQINPEDTIKVTVKNEGDYEYEYVPK